MATVEAEPYGFDFEPSTTALRDLAPMRQSETVVRRAWTAVVYIRPPGAKSELVVADEAGPSAAAAAAANAARPSSAVTRRITVLFTGVVRREVPRTS